MPVVRALVALILLLLPARLGAQEEVCDDPAAKRVFSLRIDGNRTFSDDELASRIATTPMSVWGRVPLISRLVTKQCLDEDALRLDVLRLVYFYRVRGFPDVAVEPTVTADGPKGVSVRLQVREGQPIVLRTFRVSGLELVEDAGRITRDLPARQGGRFDETTINASRDTLLRRLRNAGYPRADVFRSFNTERATRVADATLTVEPGPLARYGSVSVVIDPVPGRDAPQVDTADVRTLLGITPGQKYRERDLVEGQRRTYETELFRAVQVDLDSTSTDSILGIRIRVAEQPQRSASIGAGWGTIDCFRAQGRFTHYNFLGSVRRLELTGRVSRLGVGAPTRFPAGARALCAPDAYNDQYGDTLNYFLGASLRQASLFGVLRSPELTIYTEQRSEYNAYRRITPIGLAATANWSPRALPPITAAYTLELGRTVASPALFCVLFTSCDAVDRAIVSAERRFAAFTLSTQITRQNDPTLPTRGATLRVEARHVSPLVGADSSFRFNRLIADLTGFTKLGADGVLTGRLRVGGLFELEGFSNTANQTFIPVQERLFAGGPSTVRGFRPNELGPASYRILSYDQSLPYAVPGQAREVPVPVGGTSMVVTNIEYRVRAPGFGGIAQLALFADGGQVWTRGRDSLTFSVGALRWTPGVGLRVVTAFGAIRVDIGYNPFRPVAGAAYFDTPLAAGGDLNCVSPPPSGTGPNVTCLATYQPLRSNSLWRRFTPSISIGQIF